MTARLVGEPSVSCGDPAFDMSNRGVIDQLANWLEALGFSIEISEVAERPGKFNLVARLGEGTNGLVLAGHTDTVPYDEALWQSDPFTLSERDDRWYGLGSTDMKGFFALVLSTVAPLVNEKFDAPLTIIATADEESTMSGARALAAADVAGARYAIIGEPTSLKPVNRHKGIMFLNASLKGASGHSSNPDLGINALDASAELITELTAFRNDMKRRFTDTAFGVAYPTLNLGCIHGGDSPNRICDNVGLAFDMRILPQMESEAIFDELRHRLETAFHNHPVSLDLSLANPWVDPFSNDEEGFLKLVSNISGQDPGPVAFATEAPFLTSLGLETIVLGPGSIDNAHQPDEYLPVVEIEPTIAILRGLIERICLARHD